MRVEIDKNSGFCFGVVRAIESAENELKESDELLCLGDIVHNCMEVKRLKNSGLKIINHEQFKKLKNRKVLIRAHGEPPETYSIARKNNITLVDASCPIVISLQKKIRKGAEEIKSKDGQIVIYGKDGHAEVVGLKGHAGESTVVVSNTDDLDKIDFSRPVRFYSQTTQNLQQFEELKSEIIRRMTEQNNNSEEIDFKTYDTICRRVSNRAPELENFARKHDVVIFASDRKSSNGKYLFGICRSANSRTHFVANADDLKREWFMDAHSAGICGATSTPFWVMDEIRKKILSWTRADAGQEPIKR